MAASFLLDDSSKVWPARGLAKARLVRSTDSLMGRDTKGKGTPLEVRCEGKLFFQSS